MLVCVFHFHHKTIIFFFCVIFIFQFFLTDFGIIERIVEEIYKLCLHFTIYTQYTCYKLQITL